MEQMMINREAGRENQDLVNFVVVPKIFKEDYIVFNFKCKNKTSNMNSFEMVHWRFKIFEMVDCDGIELRNLDNFFLNCFEQKEVFFVKFNQNFINFRNINLHKELHHLLNSSGVLNGPVCESFSDSCNSLIKDSFNGNSSTGCQSINSQNSESSSVISLVFLYLSDMSRFIKLITTFVKTFKSNSVPGDDKFTCSINKYDDSNYLNLSIEIIK